MKTLSTELKVGIFAIVVILLLSYMTFKVGGMGLLWKKGYRLYVMFDNVSGLEEKSKIKVAGVDSGIVEKVQLKEGQAMLTLLMNSDVQIHEDAEASVRTTGLLGDKYLSIWAGSLDKPLLRDGDTVTNTEPPTDIDALANKLTSAADYISDIAEALTEILGKPEREAMKETIRNLQTVTDNLVDFSKTLADKGPGFIDDASKVAKNLGSFSEKLDEKGPGLIDDISMTAKDIREVVRENKSSFKETMDNIKSFSASADRIAERLDRGEGTLGKLLKEDKFYTSLNKAVEGASKGIEAVDRLRTFINFRTEYLTKESEWKGYFDITLQPRKDKYYILGVVTDPLGSSEITETTTGGVTTKEEKIKKKIEFTAQFAKRIEDLALRIGMLESTFGVGADYFLNDDKAKISLDVWDFNADEAKAKRAHAKVGMDYKVFKYFFITSGIDNLLNDNLRGIYIGGGLRFEDEDFKYIFGGAPKIPGR